MFYCYQILCFRMFNYLNASSSLMKWFFFFSEILYIHFTGYQMKAYHIDLIYILINQN